MSWHRSRSQRQRGAGKSPPATRSHCEIVNLTRLDEPGNHVFNVVGPICETGDILGGPPAAGMSRGRLLLIANTGAYGMVMASRYNLREPAEELVLE